MGVSCLRGSLVYFRPESSMLFTSSVTSRLVTAYVAMGLLIGIVFACDLSWLGGFGGYLSLTRFLPISSIQILGTEGSYQIRLGSVY